MPTRSIRNSRRNFLQYAGAASMAAPQSGATTKAKSSTDNIYADLRRTNGDQRPRRGNVLLQYPDAARGASCH